MAEAEEKLKPIRAILETIRERADYALTQLQAASPPIGYGFSDLELRHFARFGPAVDSDI
jgi:hypothetical protein